jgi:hypothetical protein
MPSRLSAIRTAVEAHIEDAFSGITITNEPMSFDPMPSKSKFPHAVILFREEDPERLDFKQERRRIRGEIHIAVLTGSGDTAEATRETVDLNMETLRDAIFADETLTNTVDNVSCNAAEVYSGPDDTLVYGEIEITTEEIF